MLPKSLPGYSLPIDSRVIATTKELSSEFPFNQDTTSGKVLGLGWVQSSIGGGTRSSSATTYLAGVVGRRNVDVLLNAQVTKLVKTGTVGGKPSFRGVQFASGPQCGYHLTVSPLVSTVAYWYPRQRRALPFTLGRKSSYPLVRSALLKSSNCLA